MGWMTGTGPLGKQPAGTFNFEPPAPGWALYLEPTPKRIRVVVAGETIADSRRAMLLHEGGQQPLYYFPPEDVRSEFLEPSDRHTHCPKKGDASYYTIRVGDHVVDAGAWYYPEPLPDAPAELEGLIAFYFNRMDHWLEEDEEIFGHPRDPYHRIDTRATRRHIRVLRDGEVLAETDDAVALFESNLPPAGTSRGGTSRWSSRTAIPAPTALTRATRATSRSSSPSGEVLKDLVWYYPDPLADALQVEDLVCFFNERVEIELDGELQERAQSPWKPGRDGEAQNAAPAQTRG